MGLEQRHVFIINTNLNLCTCTYVKSAVEGIEPKILMAQHSMPWTFFFSYFFKGTQTNNWTQDLFYTQSSLRALTLYQQQRESNPLLKTLRLPLNSSICQDFQINIKTSNQIFILFLRTCHNLYMFPVQMSKKTHAVSL